MNAMIFAAGLGTRLQPLTNNKPKALVEFRGQPLLWHAIQNVIKAGAERVVVNVHHFAQQIIDYIDTNIWDVDVLISDERDQLLETGGGLLKAKALFIPNKPILIQNADIIISTDLKMFIYSHANRLSDATLMVKKRKTTRYLLLDTDHRLCGWRNTKSGEEILVHQTAGLEEYGFSGIHLVEYHLLNEMGSVRPFSIIKSYLDLAFTHKVNAYVMKESDAWFDVGTMDKLNEAELNY